MSLAIRTGFVTAPTPPTTTNVRSACAARTAHMRSNAVPCKACHGLESALNPRPAWELAEVSAAAAKWELGHGTCDAHEDVAHSPDLEQRVPPPPRFATSRVLAATMGNFRSTKTCCSARRNAPARHTHAQAAMRARAPTHRRTHRRAPAKGVTKKCTHQLQQTHKRRTTQAQRVR